MLQRPLQLLATVLVVAVVGPDRRLPDLLAGLRIDGDDVPQLPAGHHEVLAVGVREHGRGADPSPRSRSEGPGSTRGASGLAVELHETVRVEAFALRALRRVMRVVAVRDRVVDVALVVDERRVPGASRSRVVALGLVRGVEGPELLARLRIERECASTAGLRGLGQVQDAVPDRRLDREAEVLALRDPGVVLEDLLLPDLLPGLGVEREHVPLVTPKRTRPCGRGRSARAWARRTRPSKAARPSPGRRP